LSCKSESLPNQLRLWFAARRPHCILSCSRSTGLAKTCDRPCRSSMCTAWRWSHSVAERKSMMTVQGHRCTADEGTVCYRHLTCINLVINVEVYCLCLVWVAGATTSRAQAWCPVPDTSARLTNTLAAEIHIERRVRMMGRLLLPSRRAGNAICKSTATGQSRLHCNSSDK
jgi:hypothetical protein